MTSRIYPVQRSGHLFFVKAAVGRSEAQPSILKLLVDTGASQTCLPITLLADIGYPAPKDSPKRPILTGNGLIQAPIVQIPWLNCLGQKVEHYSVLALDLSATRYVNGILGMDFLIRFQAVIDIGKEQITLPEL
jgi:predicted aspartyl protease